MNKIHNITLAGGFGTRLNKIGERTPKGLLPVDGSSIIGRMLQDVTIEPRITKRAIVSNARFHNQYEIWLLKQGLTDSIQLLNNGVQNPEERLGAIGDLLFAVQLLNWWEKDILVTPSDTLYGFKMSEFLDFCKGKPGLITVVQKKTEEEIAGRLGCAELKADQINVFEEKPERAKSPFAAIPFYLYRADTLQQLKKYQQSGGNIDAPGSVISWLLEQGVSVYAYRTDNPTLDVGIPSDVSEAANFTSSVNID